jgi:1,4-alpha-glucan branching enzyme
LHGGVLRLVRDLNRVYRDWPALHQLDCDAAGFRWIDASNAAQSVIAYLRQGDNGTEPVLVVINFTPQVRPNYRLGVPAGGAWREILNTDSELYGGSNVGNGGAVTAVDEGLHGQPHTLELTLPPLAALVLAQEQEGVA